MEAALLKGLAPCRGLRGVADVRAMGAIGVVQLNGAPDHEKIRQAFIEQGCWVRSWGDHIYLTPALNISTDDLNALIAAVCTTAAKFAA